MLVLLVLLFIIVPIAEIYVIIQVGQAIGVGWTILLLIADSIIGARLLSWQGRRAWLRFQELGSEVSAGNRERFLRAVQRAKQLAKATKAKSRRKAK